MSALGDIGIHPKQDTYLIIHADDLGMCHSINAASLAAIGKKEVTSLSVMMPCSWAPEVLLYASRHPELDIGVHLTLTSEWLGYRWRPLTCIAPGQCEDGKDNFFPTTSRDSIKYSLSSIYKELYAQIRDCESYGVTPTHLDNHMYSLLQSPQLRAVYVSLANNLSLPLFLPRNEGSVIGHEVPMTAPIQKEHHAPSTLHPRHWAEFYCDTVASLSPGVNLLSVHLAYDHEEVRAIMDYDAPWGVSWRVRDAKVLASYAFKKVLRQQQVRLINWRQAALMLNHQLFQEGGR